MRSEDEPIMDSRFDRDPSISPDAAAVRLPSSKPQGGARILSFLLQALIMAVALSLFFLFAGVAALILLYLFVAGRGLRRRRHLILHSLAPYTNPSPYQGDPDTFGLSTQDLKTLPSFDYSIQRMAMAVRMTSSDCAVCLERFRDGDRCRNLPSCGHSFHQDCVDRWLMRSPACPICRRGVLALCG